MQAGFKLRQVVQSNNRLKRKLSPESAPRSAHKSDCCKGSCGLKRIFTDHTRAVGHEVAEQQAAAQRNSCQLRTTSAGDLSFVSVPLAQKSANLSL